MQRGFFVVIVVLVVLILLALKTVKTIKGLVVGTAVVVVVLGLVTKFWPEKYSLVGVVPPSVIEKVADVATDATDVKVAKGKDGKQTVYLLLEGKWHDVRDFKTLVKGVKKYDLVTEETSYKLSKEQLKVIKELFIP